jgi:hypothetical protein
VIAVSTDLVVSRVCTLMNQGRQEAAREVFYREIMTDPELPGDEKSFLANWVGAHDEGENFLLDRDDL